MSKSDSKTRDFTLKYQNRKNTYQKKSQNRLKASDYKQLFATTGARVACFEFQEPVFLVNDNKKIANNFWNQNAKCIEASNIFANSRGYLSTREVIGKYFDSLFQPNEKYYQLISNWIDSGYEPDDHLINEFSTVGIEKTYATNLYGIFKDNYLKKFWIVSKDITEIITTKNKLKASEKHYLSLLKSSDCFIFKTNANSSEIIYLSSNVEEILGLKNFKYAEKKIDIFKNSIHPDDLFNFLEFLNSKKSQNKISLEIKYRLRLKDQTFQWFHEKAIAKLNHNGEIECWDSIVQNIQNTKILEASLIQAQKMETIGALTGGLSHDINNLLQIALGRISLHENSSNFQLSENLLKCKTAIEKCIDINRTLLELGRKNNSDRKAIFVPTLFSSLEKLISTILPSNILLKISYSKSISCFFGNFTQIEQVLLNLVINSRDALTEGGKINISAIENEKYIEFQVKDTGTGIPKGTLEYIFDPFFTTKALGKGTGLGLSTAKTIINSHDGKISAVSEIGKGTTFSIKIPIANSQEVKLDNLILLAEDDELVRKTICQTLNKRGYKVLSAKDGQEALNILNSKKIALLISDQCMPKITGTELIKEITKINKNFPVILTSGNLSEINTKNKQVFFLKKPFLISELIKHVEDLIPLESFEDSGVKENRSL